MADYCTVTGRISDIFADVMGELKVEFRTTKHRLYTSDGDVISTKRKLVETDENGDLSVDLVPGEYILSLKTNSRDRDKARIVVPDAETAQLASIIDLDPPTELNSIEQAVQDARDARDLAQQYAQDAADEADSIVAGSGDMQGVNNLSDVDDPDAARGNIGAAASSHTHPISDTTGLQSALDGKATSSQGTKADTALQPADIGTTVQAHNAVLSATTAPYTVTDQTKLGHIAVTQAVDLDALETRVNELDASVVLKGIWDSSGGSFPGAGAAQVGESWIVSVGGTVDGVEFTANDRIVAIIDNASTTNYTSNWHKLDYTDQVLSVAGKTGLVSLVKADISDLDESVVAPSGGTYSSVNDTETDASVVIQEDQPIYIEAGDFLRVLARYSSSSDTIYVGQDGTTVIDRIALMAGNTGRIDLHNLPINGLVAPGVLEDGYVLTYVHGEGVVRLAAPTGGGGGGGSVTSVNVAGGTGLESSGGPITTLGTISVSLNAASQASLSNADTAFGWGDHSLAGYLTTVGWTGVTGKPVFSTVAISGSYVDLSGLPNLGTVAPLNVASSGNAASDEVVVGDDSRLSDARTPLAHGHGINEITGLQTELDSKATAAQGGLADTAVQPADLTPYASIVYVDAQIASLVDGADGALNTLNELAAALGDDPDFAATVTTQISAKLDATSYTAADVLSKILTVDGAGSGLDADLLDGQHASAFATAIQGTKADTAHGWGDHSVAGYITSVSWAGVSGKPSFATVATSGSYNDLADKPSLFDGAYGSLSGLPALVSQAEAEAGTATTERSWSAQRVAQAIAAQASGGGTITDVAVSHASGTISVDVTNDFVRSATDALSVPTVKGVHARRGEALSTNHTQPIPGSPQNGDLVIVFQSGDSSVPTVTPQSGDGFKQSVVFANSTVLAYFDWGRYGTDITSTDLDFTGQASNSSFVIITLSAADDPIFFDGNDGLSSTYTFPTVTGVEIDDLVMALVALDDDNVSSLPNAPAGYTSEQSGYSNTAGASAFVSHKVMTAAGNETPGNFSQSSDDWATGAFRIPKGIETQQYTIDLTNLPAAGTAWSSRLQLDVNGLAVGSEYWSYPDTIIWDEGQEPHFADGINIIEFYSTGDDIIRGRIEYQAGASKGVERVQEFTGTALTLDVAQAQLFFGTLTGNTTFDFDLSNLPANPKRWTKAWTIEVYQDASTAYTYTFNNVLWGGGSPPAAPAAGAKATLTFYRDSNGDVRGSSAGLAYS